MYVMHILLCDEDQNQCVYMLPASCKKVCTLLNNIGLKGFYIAVPVFRKNAYKGFSCPSYTRILEIYPLQPTGF